MFLLVHMRIFTIFAVFVTLEVDCGDSNCASLEITSTSATGNENDMTTTTMFSVNMSCVDKKQQIDFVKVYEGSSPGFSPPVCKIKFIGYKCNPEVDCTCRTNSDMLFVTRRFKTSEAWLLVGLKNGTTVKLYPSPLRQSTDTTTTEVGSSTGPPQDNSTTTVTSVTPQSEGSAHTRPSSTNNDDSTTAREALVELPFSVVLLGSVGCVTLMVGLYVVYKVCGRRGRTVKIDQATIDVLSASIPALAMNGLTRNERIVKAALSTEDYRVSDLGVMITNEMYEESRDISLVSTSLTAGLPENVLLPPRDSGVSSVLDSGDDVPFPGVNMSQRARMPLPPEAFRDDDDQGAVGGAWTYSEEGDYTEIDDVLDQTNEPVNDADLYTGINDVKREKIERRVRRDSEKRDKSTRNTTAF